MHFYNIEVELKTDIANETLWGIQEQIAEIFDRDVSTISRHVTDIFKDVELEEKALCRKYKL